MTIHWASTVCLFEVNGMLGINKMSHVVDTIAFTKRNKVLAELGTTAPATEFRRRRWPKTLKFDIFYSAPGTGVSG